MMLAAMMAAAFASLTLMPQPTHPPTHHQITPETWPTHHPPELALEMPLILPHAAAAMITLLPRRDADTLDADAMPSLLMLLLMLCFSLSRCDAMPC